MRNIKTILREWKDGHDSISREEKQHLLDKAKDSYYKSGKELLSDHEYDILEKSLGYENDNYVGTRHSKNYTVEHPFVMGSLAKVQIHSDKEGHINWDEYFSKLQGWIKDPEQPNIITPKFDGCSYEVVIDNINKKIVSISGRGDSNYGKDLSKQLKHIFDEDTFWSLADAVDDVVDNRNLEYPSLVVLRGEVLVKKSTFAKKYADKFANTRAFVAGMLNRDDENLPEYQDLDCVIYDFRIKESIHDKWIDIDWTDLRRCMNDCQKFFPMYTNAFLFNKTISTPGELKWIYEYFEEIRNSMDYSLDGIVVKPTDEYRVCNLKDRRPSDCVAIKFIPMLEPTEVTDIEWNLGKTGEWIPTIITKPVQMDGKNITRASAFNYGYLITKKISVGTKVILSLAGDIIPFIYKVEDTSKFDKTRLGFNFPASAEADGIHLIEKETDNGFKLKHSCLALNITGFGEANVDKFVTWVRKECEGDEFFGIEAKPIPEHILLCNPSDVQTAIGGKTGKSIKEAIEKFIREMDLKSVILSCNFKLCGDKVATQIVSKLIHESYDFASMPTIAYQWADDVNSDEFKFLNKILHFNGRALADFMLTEEQKKSIDEQNKKLDEQIPVILTGEPNNYSNKAEFLKCNPQYRLTGSWKEVKIVFTNSLESTTGKMKKAHEKGIAIKVY